MKIVRLGLVAALLAAFSSATPALAAKRDNAIRFATDNVLNNVDAYFNDLRMGYIFSLQVWDTLIYRDPRTGEYKGQLATSWKSIDDRTIEFELRKGVKFHNGAAFDADDVVYTLNFIANPESRIVTQSRVSWIDHAEKVDPYKVRVVTKQPFPAAIEFLAVYIFIYPHEYHARVGPLGMNEKPVGTGPYRVTEHARGKYIRLTRNADYFEGSPRARPRIENFEIRFIPDVQTQVAEMLAGGLDMMECARRSGAAIARDAQPPGGARRDQPGDVPASQRQREDPDAAIARYPGAQGDHASHRPRSDAQVAGRGGRAHRRHLLLSLAVRLHRQGRAALRLRSRQGKAIARRGRVCERLRR
jgi:ABC-type transport system substrate-binding protein